MTLRLCHRFKTVIDDRTVVINAYPDIWQLTKIEVSSNLKFILINFNLFTCIYHICYIMHMKYNDFTLFFSYLNYSNECLYE